MIERGTSGALVYIGGPYTVGDLMLNLRAVIDAFEVLARAGLTPIAPHLNALIHLVHPHPPTHWYEIDKRVLARCDVFLRLPGESVGADAELSHAERNGLWISEGSAERLVEWWFSDVSANRGTTSVTDERRTSR